MNNRNLTIKKVINRNKEKIIEYSVLVSVIFILCLILFKKYIWGENYYIFQGTDTIRATFPAYHIVAKYFEQGWSWWSFNMGIGASQLSRATALSDPFNYILFFSKDNLPTLIIVAVIARIICAGTFFYHYLSNFKFTKYSKFVGALAYAFCGYVIVTGRDYGFATVCVYLPLVLNGMEKVFQKKKYLSFIVSLTLLAIYFNIMYYMTVFIVIGYFFIRFCSFSQRSLKSFFEYIFGFAVSGITSILLSAFWLFPVAYLTGQSPRIGVKAGINFSEINLSALFTAILRSFGIDTLGNNVSANQYYGYANQYLQLATYTSIIAIIMIFIILSTKNKIWKNRILLIIGIITCITSFNLFPYILNGFSTVTYRWSFGINFFLAVCVTVGLELLFSSNCLSLKKFIFSLIVTLSAITYLKFYLSSNENINFKSYLIDLFLKDTSYIIMILFVLVLISLVFLYKKKVVSKKICELLFVIVFISEVLFNYNDWINKSPAYSSNTDNATIGYFDDSQDLIKMIKEKDCAFYRINKDYDSVYRNDGLPSDNDALVQEYYGLKYYCSLNPLGYITFLQNMDVYVKNPLDKIDENIIKPKDIKSASLNFINGVGDRYDLMSFLGVKYFITQNTDVNNIPSNFNLVDTYKDILYYENEDYNSLVFAIDKAISTESFNTLTKEEKDRLIYSAVIIDGMDGAEYTNPTEILESDVSIASIANKNRRNLKIKRFKEDYISGNIKVDKEGFLVTTIPFDKGWKIYIDGEKIETLSLDDGLLGGRISAGNHNFIIKYYPYSMKLGFCISGLTILIIFIAYFKRKVLLPIINTKLLILEEKTIILYLKSKGFIRKKVSCLNKYFKIYILLNSILMILTIITLSKYGVMHKTMENNSQQITDWNAALFSEVIEDAQTINLEHPEQNAPKRVISGKTQNLPDNCDLGIISYYVYDKNNITIQIIGRDSEYNPHIWLRQYSEILGWGAYYEVEYKN